MFASNFILKEASVTHTRGKEKLKKFAQSKTIATGNTMENHFCGECGTLMYRISSGFPGMLITRIGTSIPEHMQSRQNLSLPETRLNRCERQGEPLR